MSSSVKEKIRNFLSQDLGIDVSGTSDAGALFTSGLIDSFALLELMAFMEREFAVKIEIADMSIEQLDTIDALAALT